MSENFIASMIFSKKTSWMLQTALFADLSNPLIEPRYLYIQDIKDLSFRRFFMTDGRHFICAQIEEAAFWSCMSGLSLESVALKGSLLLVQQSKLVKTKAGYLELLVEKCLYLGEGTLKDETTDFNEAFFASCRKNELGKREVPAIDLEEASLMVNGAFRSLLEDCFFESYDIKKGNNAVEEDAGRFKTFIMRTEEKCGHLRLCGADEALQSKQSVLKEIDVNTSLSSSTKVLKSQEEGLNKSSLDEIDRNIFTSILESDEDINSYQKLPFNEDLLAGMDIKAISKESQIVKEDNFGGICSEFSIDFLLESSFVNNVDAQLANEASIDDGDKEKKRLSKMINLWNRVNILREEEAENKYNLMIPNFTKIDESREESFTVSSSENIADEKSRPAGTQASENRRMCRRSGSLAPITSGQCSATNKVENAISMNNRINKQRGPIRIVISRNTRMGRQARAVHSGEKGLMEKCPGRYFVFKGMYLKKGNGQRKTGEPRECAAEERQICDLLPSEQINDIEKKPIEIRLVRRKKEYKAIKKGLRCWGQEGEKPIKCASKKPFRKLCFIKNQYNVPELCKARVDKKYDRVTFTRYIKPRQAEIRFIRRRLGTSPSKELVERFTFKRPIDVCLDKAIGDEADRGASCKAVGDGIKEDGLNVEDSTSLDSFISDMILESDDFLIAGDDPVLDTAFALDTQGSLQTLSTTKKRYLVFETENNISMGVSKRYCLFQEL